MASESILVPVYTDDNGIHRVQLFTQSDDGSFRRTGVEPLRVLREHIVGISDCKGELLSVQHDREERIWSVPTVKLYAHRPRGYYEFLRATLVRNQLPVLMTPGMHGRVVRFGLHYLALKPAISFGVLRLLKKRYAEAIDLWDEVPDAGILDTRKCAG